MAHNRTEAMGLGRGSEINARKNRRANVILIALGVIYAIYSIVMVS